MVFIFFQFFSFMHLTFLIVFTAMCFFGGVCFFFISLTISGLNFERYDNGEVRYLGKFFNFLKKTFYFFSI